jgi:S-DNA-T family DNA segregation ATPase FtsK/SpoIIIE
MKALWWLLRHPGFVAAPVVVAVAVGRYGWPPLAYTTGAVVGVLAVWGRAHPATFDRWAAPRLRSVKRRWWDYAGKRWREVLDDCELTRDNRRTGELMVPRLEKVRAVTPSIDTLRVRMVRGQDERLWTDRGDTLAAALAAHRVAVTKHRPGRLTVVVERENPFTRPLPAPDIPETPQEVNFARLDIGDDEFGQPVLMSLIGGSHPLVVGATGSGKGSALWGPLRAMGPAIREHWCRIRMIDLKGGTETEIGKPLFHRRAITVDEALDLLGEAREQMRTDQARLRTEKLRRATVGPDWPLDVIMIDEFAMLSAYGGRSEVREALALLAEIMTQGRNTLYTVAGYIHEPSKDILEIRELFTSRYCLGVTAASHVDMALGDGARDRGAIADEIPLDEEHAGIGFRVDKGSRHIRRFRLGYTTDTEIAELVARCTPVAQPTLTALPGGQHGEEVA